MLDCCCSPGRVELARLLLLRAEGSRASSTLQRRVRGPARQRARRVRGRGDAPPGMARRYRGGVNRRVESSLLDCCCSSGRVELARLLLLRAEGSRASSTLQRRLRGPRAADGTPGPRAWPFAAGHGPALPRRAQSPTRALCHGASMALSRLACSSSPVSSHMNTPARPCSRANCARRPIERGSS